ncbi:MAG TPA: ABC transporter ATP-binding protein, partial [Rhodospirillaceae bacterium]|nr:ABC transporter ATP-binding protein [Rhodospirillaceae bacterium]
MNTSATPSAPRLQAWSITDRLEVLLTSVLINILSLALPLAMLQVYDRVIPNKSLGTITLLILGVGVAILIDAIMRYARAHLMAMIGARFEHKAGSAAIRHLLGCDLAAFEQEGSGVHIDRFNALNQLRDYYGGQAYVAIFDLPFILLFIAMVFYFGGELGIVLIALLVIYGLGVALFGNRLATAIERLQRADDSRFDYIISTLTGLPLLKAQAMEPIAERRYETFNLDSAVEGQRVNQRVGSLGDLSFLMSQLAIVAIVAYGAYLVVNGHLSVGGLAACTLL